MKNTKKTLIAAAALTVTIATLIALGPVAAQADPGQGPFAEFLSQNPEAASYMPAEGRRGAASHRMGGHRGRRGSPIVRYLLSEYLGLTDEQKEVVKEAMTAGREESREARKAMFENRKAIRDAVKNGQPVDTLADEAGRLVAERIKAGAAKKAEVMTKLNLTPEQQEKIEKMHERFGSMRARFAGKFVQPEAETKP
jgi:Spy/CpxP family protein refolding chaperone